MSWNSVNGAFAIFGLVLLASFAGMRPVKISRLAAGTWGGQHIRIAVGSGPTVIEYDCANGTIAGPLLLDRRGNFRWKGSHIREHGGPIRIDEEPRGEPAIYSGSVKGNTMTLTVTLVNTDQAIGTFMLIRGTPGKVFKCR